MAGNTVVLTFLGEDAPLRRAVRGVDNALSGLGKGIGILGGLGGASSVAVAAIAAVPLAFAGIGVAAAAQNEQVRSAFTGLADHVKSEVTAMSAPFVPVLGQIARDAREVFDALAPELGGMFATAAPMVGQLADGLLDLVVNIMPGLQAAFGAAGPLITTLATGISGLGTGLSGFFAGLASGSGGAAAGLGGIFTVVNGLLPIIGQLIGQMANSLGPVFAALAPLIVSLASTVGAMLTPIIAALGPPITMVVQALAAALMPILPVITSAFEQMAPILGVLAQQFGGLLVQAIQMVAPLLPPLIGAFFQIVAALLPILPPLMQLAQELMPLFGAVLTAAAGIITGVIVPAIVGLAGFFTGLVTTVVGIVQGIKRHWDLLPKYIQAGADTVQAWLGSVGRWFRELPGNILRAVGDLGRLLVNAGGDVLRGLWNGISGAAGWLRSQIGGFFGSLIPGWAKGFLGIRSPSKVFADIGKWVPEGMAQGITGNAAVVQSAVTGMASVQMPSTIGPAAGGVAGGRGGDVAVTFRGNTSDALATVIMQLIRTGQIQITQGR